MARRQGYYYGYSGGGSPIAQQLNLLGANIRGGMGDIADDIRSGARLRLEEKLLGHRLGREQEADRRFTEYEQPVLEQRAAEAKAQKEFDDQPFIPPISLFRGSQFPTTVDDAMHIAGHPTREIKEIFGYETKTNPADGSITHLERKLPDGSTRVLTEGIVRKNPRVLRTIIGGWSRMDRAIPSQRAKLTKFKEENPDHPGIAQIDAALKELDDIENDPKRMLEGWRRQEQEQLELVRRREDLGLPITHNEKELTYIRKQIEHLRGEPDRELARKLTQARIEKLGQGPTPKTPTPPHPSVLEKRERDKMADLRALEVTINTGTDREGEPIPPESLEIEARDWHLLSEANYVYVYVPEKITPYFRGGPDVPAHMEKVKLSPGMTSKKVQLTADKYGMSVTEVLQRLGVLTQEGET